MPAYELITGTWGDFQAPQIVRAEAFPGPKAEVPLVSLTTVDTLELVTLCCWLCCDGRDFQNASGPGVGDTLILEFNVPLETRPLDTMQDVLTLFEFNPPLTNLTFNGRYVAGAFAFPLTTSRSACLFSQLPVVVHH